MGASPNAILASFVDCLPRCPGQRPSVLIIESHPVRARQPDLVPQPSSRNLAAFLRTLLKSRRAVERALRYKDSGTGWKEHH